MATEKFNFEKSLEKLETIIEKLESGDLALDASMKEFENGFSLLKNCQTALKKAENKVQILTEKNNLKNFEEL